MSQKKKRRNIADEMSHSLRKSTSLNHIKYYGRSLPKIAIADFIQFLFYYIADTIIKSKTTNKDNKISNFKSHSVQRASIRCSVAAD